MVPHNFFFLHRDRKFSHLHCLQYTRRPFTPHSDIISVPPSIPCWVHYLLLLPDDRWFIFPYSILLQGYLILLWDPLIQLTPNSFLLLCGVAIVFNYYNISLTPPLFHFFFYLKKSELGCFTSPPDLLLNFYGITFLPINIGKPTISSSVRPQPIHAYTTSKRTFLLN